MSETLLHGLRLEHAIPGRVRVKYPRMKANPALAQDLHHKLSAIDGVTHVQTQPTIGSVTVHYHPDAGTSKDFLLKLAAAFGLSLAHIDAGELEEWLSLLGAGTNGANPGTALAESMESLTDLIETGITKLSRRELNIGFLLPMMLTAFGVRSLFVSEQLKVPSWYEFFWFAFGAYYTLNKPESPGDAAT
ncbi:MAG TPA: hypothetical protein VJR03_07545 [Nitrospira sp.]|nr:hypothetical protein [Nitrospira sp.]